VTGTWLSEPASLWATTRLGREEYVQKLLATLVLGEEARGWNVPRPASERGAEFLRALHAATFDGTPDADPVFVDEFELPARTRDERAGWPDHAVIWPDRLFIIELKTERRSHRRDQLSHYLRLAAHHHPNIDVDLLYLTPTMEAAPPTPLPARSRYAHWHWPSAYALVREVWATTPIAWEAAIVDHLETWIRDVEAGSPLPERALPEPPAADVDWLKLAAAVQRDGQQRAGELTVTDPEELEALRVELRDELRTGPTIDETAVTHVMPWLWHAETSGGQPLTELGAVTGYELRLSRYAAEQTDDRALHP
jgi:hypothetical protein